MAYGLTYSLELVAASSRYAQDTTISGFPTGSAARTIEAWIRYGGTGEQYVMGAGAETAQGSFAMSVTNTSSGRILLRLNGGNIQWTATAAIDGGWHHIAITHDGSSSVSDSATKCYLDGVSLGNNVATVGTLTVNTVATRARVGTGDSNTPSNFWDENISLVRVWNVARSSADIANNACSVLGATTNLLAEWTLDNVYTDNSGNGYDLTAVNSPTFSIDTPSTCAVVGPTTVKTMDGVTLSTQLKTLDSVALASIKSIDGAT